MTPSRPIRRNWSAGILGLAASLLVLSACASSPAGDDDTQQANATEVDRDSRAYRDCLRRVRRTGSRLPRSECDAAVFGGGFHSRGEDSAGQLGEPGSINR